LKVFKISKYDEKIINGKWNENADEEAI